MFDLMHGLQLVLLCMPATRSLTHSPFSARLLLTIDTIRYYQVPIGLVFSIHDSTEAAIQKMIEASQRNVKIQSEG